MPVGSGTQAAGERSRPHTSLRMREDAAKRALHRPEPRSRVQAVTALGPTAGDHQHGRVVELTWRSAAARSRPPQAGVDPFGVLLCAHVAGQTLAAVAGGLGAARQLFGRATRL